MDPDDQTAALILQIQLSDLAALTSTAKGKQRATDGPSDQDLALQLCRQDLEAHASTLRDRAMGRSIARAVETDRHILAREAAVEAAEADDRRLAHELHEGAVVLPTAPAASPNATQGDAPEAAAADEAYLAKLTALYVSEADGAKLLAAAATTYDDGDDDDSSQQGESSTRAAKRQRTGAAVALERRCEACCEWKKYFDVATLAGCRHEYCRECLDRLFLLSTTDETLFPPRCCRQPIALAEVRVFVTAETAREFERRRPELETPNRTYCCRRECSAWIPPQDIEGEVATCPACIAETCTICKDGAHEGDCPGDEDTQLLLRTADERRWQRCYSCRRVVELDVGCNHMTCYCGAQFCYVCGDVWKTCRCNHWEEANLMRRVDHIQQRRPLAGPPVPDPPMPPALPAVEDEVEAEGAEEAEAGEAAAEAEQAGEAGAEEATEQAEPQAEDEETAGLDADEARTPDHRGQDRVALAQHLRDNHECGHARWNFVEGRHRCEVCRHTLPAYIFECRMCMVRACNQCRRNRL